MVALKDNRKTHFFSFFCVFVPLLCHFFHCFLLFLCQFFPFFLCHANQWQGVGLLVNASALERLEGFSLGLKLQLHFVGAKAPTTTARWQRAAASGRHRGLFPGPL
jgi:hypothetical protein